MDPITLAEAATALLLAQAGGSMAGEAGKAAWHGIEHLYKIVRDRAHGEPDVEQALDELGASDSPEQRATIERSIAQWAESDPAFQAQLESVLSQARAQPGFSAVIAQATDDAAQVNIGRDNTGPITF